MSESRVNAFCQPEALLTSLKSTVAFILEQAKQAGATAAEVGISQDTGLSVQVRNADVETVEFNNDSGFGVTVYFGQRKGSASTTDTSEQAIKETVQAACDIARYTSEDPYSGLAPAELMATELLDLSLYHPSYLNADQAIRLALAAESAALGYDARITQSDGVSLSSHEGVKVYGNSHGFLHGYPVSRHSLSCVMIAGNRDAMQRDYAYTVARDYADLDDFQQIAQLSAYKTIQRLGAKPIKTVQAPVIFSKEVAAGLLSHGLGALKGSAQYRKSSFLQDSLGQSVFPEWLSLVERPHIAKGLASASFDSEGVATYEHAIVEKGHIASYILGSYAARKLNMQTTANASGIHNVYVTHQDDSFEQLLAEMGSGLLVTELMGQGVNGVTGDYSRGASGFWVENGQIAFPVQEVTIAGNLLDMYSNIRAIANDIEHKNSILTGSILINRMTIAGL